MSIVNRKDYFSTLQSTGYRLGISLYGVGAFIIPCLLATIYDPKIYKVLGEIASDWRDQPPIYSGSHTLFWLAIPIGLFLFFAPRLSQVIPRMRFKKSQGFAIYEFVITIALSSIAFINFGLHSALAIEFVSYGFIIGITDYLRGFYLELDFASNAQIAKEARIEKLRLVHRKWFTGISALVTVAVAVCVTSALKLYDVWREDFGISAAELMIRTFVILILYAGAGLLLGPFAYLLNILGIIENQFDKIETSIPRSRIKYLKNRKVTNTRKA